MANVMNNINGDVIKAFLIKHKLPFGAAGVMLLSLIIGGIMSGSSKATVDNLQSQMNMITVELTQLTEQAKEVKEVIVPGDTDLDTKRWNSDDRYVAEWLLPAFAFSNASEYNANRDTMINKLSATDPFIVDYLPVYKADYSEQDDERQNIDDGARIKSTIKSFKTYVTKVDTDTGKYSYIALITYSSSLPSRYTGDFVNGEGALTATYDVTSTASDFSDAVISNFKVVAIRTEKP